MRYKLGCVSFVGHETQAAARGPRSMERENGAVLKSPGQGEGKGVPKRGMSRLPLPVLAPRRPSAPFGDSHLPRPRR